jgi:hypothetical protein
MTIHKKTFSTMNTPKENSHPLRRFVVKGKPRHIAFDEYMSKCGQRVIFKTMSQSRLTTSNAPLRHAQDIIVAKQLSLVALSNFLCWFPIGFMGLLSLLGREISNDVYAWTTVIVLPINSAANPLLYTIPVIMDKWEKFKFSG